VLVYEEEKRLGERSAEMNDSYVEKLSRPANYSASCRFIVSFLRTRVYA